jgi:hypothetical protein
LFFLFWLQTRLHAMAPLTTIDMAAAAIFCIRYGMSWQAAVLRYSCCLVLALVVTISLSWASRANFITHYQQQELEQTRECTGKQKKMI